MCLPCGTRDTALHVGAGLCACPDAGNHVGADLCLGMIGKR